MKNLPVMPVIKIGEKAENLVFQAGHRKIAVGEVVFLDVAEKTKMAGNYFGFKPIKKFKKFSGATFQLSPILIFRITNPENFKPEISGEKWQVRVEKIEITLQPTTNNAFQRVLVHIHVVERVENTYEFYDEYSEQFVIVTKSGAVIICRDTFPTEKEVVEYRNDSNQMIMEVLNVYARVSESARTLIFQKLVGGVSKEVLIEKRASEIAQDAFRNNKRGATSKFNEAAKKEVEEYLKNLPEMPKTLKSV